MIDVHMIVYDEPQWQIDRCLESLKNEPITLHIVQGVEEWPPTIGRAKGYSLGTHPYHAYVDPDDYIVPGAFQLLLDAIGDADVCYGWEYVLDRENKWRVKHVLHHAFLVKRSLDIDRSVEWRIIQHTHLKFKTIQQPLYYFTKGELI
jgi:hypothetical protein